MKKADMVAAVQRILDRAGWQSAQLRKGCFDLFASSEEDSLILRVAANIDATNREDTEEMKRACQFLGAAPLVVGVRSSRRELRPQVIYERYGVPTIRPDTLDSYLRLQQETVVLNRKGGYAVSIDPERLDERRREEGYSWNALAKEIGVSRKTIQNYRENGVAQPEKAERLENTLGRITAPINIFRTRVAVTRRTHPVAERLTRIGLDASGFTQAPFDAAARDEDDRFIAKEERRTLPDPMIRFLQELAVLADSTTFLVTDREDYDGISTIREERLNTVRDKDELKDEIGA